MADSSLKVYLPYKAKLEPFIIHYKLQHRAYLAFETMAWMMVFAKPGRRTYPLLELPNNARAFGCICCG